jgi:hypothetical protein
MSSPDLVVVIADALRLRAIRLAGHFHGRVLYFSDSNLISAFESIRAHEPAVVALEGHFAHTPQGRAFAERLQKLALPGLEVNLITFSNGAWSTSVVTKQTSAGPIITAAVVAAAATTPVVINTRRVPRFSLMNPRAMKIDGAQTNLIDMSVMGAQVISTPPLRPNQKLKVVLPDEGDSLLTVTAAVAWSNFEFAKNAPQPHYRAGMEFTDAAAAAIEDFCKRHCASEPLPIRL